MQTGPAPPGPACGRPDTALWGRCGMGFLWVPGKGQGQGVRVASPRHSWTGRGGQDQVLLLEEVAPLAQSEEMSPTTSRVHGSRPGKLQPKPTQQRAARGPIRQGPSGGAPALGPPGWFRPPATLGHCAGREVLGSAPHPAGAGLPRCLTPASSVWAFPSSEQELLRFSAFSGGRGPGESGCPSLGGKSEPGLKPTLILLQPFHPTGSSRRGGRLAGPQPGSAGPGSQSHSPLSWPAPRQAGGHLRVAGQLRLLRPPCPGSRATGAVLQMKQRHREKGQACHQGPEGHGTAKGQLRQHVRPTHHPASKNPLKLWWGCPQ